MEVGSFDHQNVSSPRGGQAVHHGCAMSTMSYFTFAMIAVYTAINANNVRYFFHCLCNYFLRLHSFYQRGSAFWNIYIAEMRASYSFYGVNISKWGSPFWTRSKTGNEKKANLLKNCFENICEIVASELIFWRALAITNLYC